jgi:RND family efflux transporter MFP subunit
MTINSILRSTRWRLGLLATFAVFGGYLFWGRAKPPHLGTTFVARRGPLDITVLNGGSIESEEKGEIKCEVKGGQGVKILRIVEEGYLVTEDDVKTNKVLVELDSADLRNKITQQEITFGSTEASLVDAQQAYDIQLNQNLSDVKAVEQKTAFARMDFDKYLGDRAAGEILCGIGLKTNLVSELTKATNVDTASVTFDFTKYADIDLLGDGEAKQKLRELQDAVQMAQKELHQAESTLEGTKRLFAKDFVTRIDLDRDQLTDDNDVLKVKKAETALNLFIKYEFRKSAQEFLGKYIESLREQERTRKGAISKMAQAEAKLKSAQAKDAVEDRQLKELKEQIDKCIIKAPRPGLVVYGSGGETRYWRDEEQIREGATVREGQTVLTIPDLRKTCIKVKIHESYIKRIAKGQTVAITADAFPDRKLDGEITQVGVLPDSENSWLNPDMKVYRTTISIKGQHDWIRPGMSAKVQILINHLADVVHVPLQAVSPVDDKKVCYILDGGKLAQREVEVGEFNDEFIEIKKGLKENEIVCLRLPTGISEKPVGEKQAAPAKVSPKPAERMTSTASTASANQGPVKQ